MVGIIETVSIRFPVFVLLIATVVLGSGAYEGNGRSGGSLAQISKEVTRFLLTEISPTPGGTGSASAFASAYAAADPWQPFPGSGSLAESHDGHKGIRSYDNAGGNRPNDEGNRRGAGCSKCKWEDDDYWEKGWEDEAEPEDEEDGDDCYDDGQYKKHDHGHGHGNKGGSPPGVQKLGAPNTSGATGVGTGPTFGATPVKQGGPWNAKSPVSGQQPGPGWTTGPGTPSKPTWNQGFDNGPTPSGTGSRPSGNLPNVGAARPADASGPKTGSECSGGYQHGTGCAQGSSGVGPVKQLPLVGFNPGNVQKVAPSDYAAGPTVVYNPQGSPTVQGCSNNPYDTSCADKSVDGTKPRDSSVVPSYGPSVGQGQHPGGGSPQSSFGSPYDSSARSTGNTVRPVNPPNFNAVANTVSSSVAYASTGSGVGHPASWPSTPSPTYSSGPLPGSPGFSGGHVPYGSQKPSHTNVKGRPSDTTSKQDASKDGDSKIFYVDVKPAPGSPMGVRPRTTTSIKKPSYQPVPYDSPGIKPFYQPTPYGGPGTTKPSYQPTPYGGPSTVKPSYQPTPYDGPGTTRPPYQPTPYGGPSTVKPSYQPAPYDGPGTTRPSYQPTPYGGPSTVKPSYQPAPYDSPGITKPSYQPAPHGSTETTKSSYQFPSKDTNVGCTRGAEDCGSASGCSGGTNLNGSPDYKPCGQPGLPLGVNKTSGPVGGGQFAATTTSKPIGLGNPFLQPGIAGAFAGATAWSNVGSATASNPAHKKDVSIGGETTKPIGKDNPFLGGSGHGRGDIEIGNPPDAGTPGGFASWSPDNDLANTGLGQTNVNPFFGDKTQQGSVRPSDRYPGSSWSSGPVADASSSAAKSPSAAPRGSGSGGGVGISLGGFASDKLGQTGHDGGSSFPGAFSGAFSSSQSSSNSGAGDPTFGHANGGNWASSGANAASQAGSGAWASSGASAYAASSANSWAGSQPSFVKG
ncbi:hypothetical protein WN51_09105 [Melipona quadrifasciata]|uniref:Uncharacterized protein n=1 Tax=Melipona quadrifasciata TaxID=166423 RepID=A0A0M9AAI2_9HYME|nr:hypothetical protein WN51_09105 [Melipona quadrifasciata]